MSVTAPLEHLSIEEFDHEIQISDDLVIAVDQPREVLHVAAKVLRDPVIPFLYLGILSLLTIIATSAYLAL